MSQTASQTASVWLVIVLALLAANLPFLNQRVLALVPLAGGKNLAIRLGELVLLYFMVGGIGLALEDRAGQIAPQAWQFYAITGALFLVAAFPGFVWRYLMKHNDVKHNDVKHNDVKHNDVASAE